MASTVASLVAASGVLDVPADPVATDTVTIGDITYTFIDTPAAAYDVDVAGTRAGSISNLVAAINRSGTPGATTYHANTVQNPYVSAVAGTNELTITARVPGSIGNGIATSTSEVDIVFAAVTLEGGTGRVDTHVSDILSLNQVNAEVQTELKKITVAED
jgi:hypothetical protein